MGPLHKSEWEVWLTDCKTPASPPSFPDIADLRAAVVLLACKNLVFGKPFCNSSTMGMSAVISSSTPCLGSYQESESPIATHCSQVHVIDVAAYDGESELILER